MWKTALLSAAGWRTMPRLWLHHVHTLSVATASLSSRACIPCFLDSSPTLGEAWNSGAFLGINHRPVENSRLWACWSIRVIFLLKSSHIGSLGQRVTCSPWRFTFSDTLLEIYMPQYISFIVHSFMTISMQAYVDLLMSLILKRALKIDFTMIAGSQRLGRVVRSWARSWHQGGTCQVPEYVLYTHDPT